MQRSPGKTVICKGPWLGRYICNDGVVVDIRVFRVMSASLRPLPWRIQKITTDVNEYAIDWGHRDPHILVCVNLSHSYFRLWHLVTRPVTLLLQCRSWEVDTVVSIRHSTKNKKTITAFVSRYHVTARCPRCCWSLRRCDCQGPTTRDGKLYLESRCENHLTSHSGPSSVRGVSATIWFALHYSWSIQLFITAIRCLVRRGSLPIPLPLRSPSSFWQQMPDFTPNMPTVGLNVQTSSKSWETWKWIFQAHYDHSSGPH